MSAQSDQRDMSGIIGYIGRIGWIGHDDVFHDDLEQEAEGNPFHVVPLGEDLIRHLIEIPQHGAVCVHDPNQHIGCQVQIRGPCFQFLEQLRC